MVCLQILMKPKDEMDFCLWFLVSWLTQIFLFVCVLPIFPAICVEFDAIFVMSFKVSFVLPSLVAKLPVPHHLLVHVQPTHVHHDMASFFVQILKEIMTVMKHCATPEASKGLTGGLFQQIVGEP